MRAGLSVFFLFLGAMLFAPTDAQAYLDPATGTAIIQGLLAVLGALAVALRIFWHRVVALFRFRAPAPREPK